nr:SPARC-like [Aotus nancymaae]
MLAILFCFKHPFLHALEQANSPAASPGWAWSFSITQALLCLLPCRYLSHTELAPLRAPLIPMEHCTTRFFETCDLDNDKYIALDEWAGCFGIKQKDIDKDLVI